MAERQPTDHDFLAVVSEWESQTLRGGRVGNAYPLINLSTNEVVTQPREQFANAGAVFLISRGTLNAWDFIVLRPRWNDRYRNADERDCCFIPSRTPDLLESPSQAETVAVVLHHPGFDLESTTRQLINPRHGVTPLFFIARGNSFFGPFARDATLLSTTLEGTVARIDYRSAREDGIIYEWTRDELTSQGMRLVTYQHPDPSLNRVLDSPMLFALGPVRKITSLRPRDALSESALIDWYLQRCSMAEVSPTTVATLRSAFRELPGDDPVLLSARLKKIDREIMNHRAFVDHRERLARRYLESEPGQKRLAELFEQAVERKSAEIQEEVDRRDSQLAARREELARQLMEADQAHQSRLAELQAERDGLLREIEQLRHSASQIQESLSDDLSKLTKLVREQLPLFAALGTSRWGEVTLSTPGGMVARPPSVEFHPVAPSTELRPITSEARLVDLLTGELARQGLHFSRDFLANIYVCLKAEPLNLIIGPPGYGKSMLVATLAQALGHADALLRIAVRRSWGEDRHLLGYYDNFHGRYDPGTTGLVPRMLQAAADWVEARLGIYLVLLDEFNLAAPEYYFAQLLQALPSEDVGRQVVLYDGSVVEATYPPRVPIGPNIRFWGTINYDETTERLSPRTLDRTGMIFLGSEDVRPMGDELHAPMPGVAAGDLFEKYLRDAEQCPEGSWSIISKVLEFLHQSDPALGPRLEVSPRVRRAIKRYLANATDVLSERLACDFAIQQRILPVLRGRGDAFLTRVRRLRDLLAEASLYRSASHVEEAIRRAEQQFGELDFLSY